MTAPESRSSSPAIRSPEWFLGATRWTQVTFTDDDPGRFDLDFWVEVMRRTRSNALCLSAGGYMAFYPTSIPFHHRSAHLGDSDPFGAFVEAARSLGMHVMARVDPHAVHDDAAQAHPEWLARDSDGNPMPHPSFPGLWLTDPFTSYHREFMTEVALEIVRDYDVDALFANRWEGPKKVSYSEQAARDFRDSTGFDLPHADDPGHQAWGAYREWRSRRLSELVVLWDDAVRGVRPHVRFIPNRGEMLTRDLVPELVEDRYPMFFVDKQSRSTTEPLWVAGRVGKRARGLHPDRPVALISSVGPESHQLRWKDSVADPNELITWICDGFAHGALPWFTKFKAECFDTRWVAPLETAFGLHAKVEPIYRTLPTTAEVVLLDSPSRQASNGPIDPFAPYRSSNLDEDGFCQALVEARIPFEFVAVEALTLDRLADARVLVLPNAPGLTSDQAGVIEAYIASGGGVVAAHDVGLTDDGTALRLGDALGVRLVVEPRGPIKNNYIALNGSHPVSAGYDGASRIVGGTRVLGVETLGDARAVFDFVPDYPDLPMEEVYPRPGVVRPAVVARSHPSGGRSVYLAFNLGEIFAETLQSDHSRLIANAIRWAAGDEPARVTLEGPGFADIAVRADADAIAVTIVNLNNPHAMRGQNRETIPLPPQELVLRVPEGVTGGRARLVIADRDVPLTIKGAQGRVHIPAVEHLELVHVLWSR